MHNILVSNIGFGKASAKALAELKSIANVSLNDAGTRYSEEDFLNKISDAHIIIAGTEKITKIVMQSAKNLNLIARVGVGVDNIDLAYAQDKKINISYTPEAPSTAVPEFTLALILNLLKGIPISDRKAHQSVWHRPMGRMLSSMKVGIVGAGKIGSRVMQLIQSISPTTSIYYYDPHVASVPGAKRCELAELFREVDLVSLHIPFNENTKGIIDERLIASMQPGSYLVNTARGGIVDENALYKFATNKHLAGVALDVYEQEPYNGPLAELDNCLLTAHIGSATEEVRAIMEEQIVEDVIRFIKKQPLLRPLNGFNFCG